MKDVIYMMRIREVSLVIPFYILGVLFWIEAIYYLIRFCQKKESRFVRHNLAAAIFFSTLGLGFFLRQLLAFLLPFFTWLVLTIVTARKEKKAGKSPDRSKNRCIPWIPRHSKGHVCSIVVFWIVFIGLFVPYVGSGVVYQMLLDCRFDMDDREKYQISEFDGLMCDEMQVESNQGQKLAGFLYYTQGEEKKGVVVFAHGYAAGGHYSYVPYMNALAQRGYYVFAYDATGNGESEGEGIIGLPQQIIDLDYVISFVENLEQTKELPVVLWGHSWGGYTVTNEAAFHPEIKAVVSFAGFNYSMDLIRAWGPRYVGKLTDLMIPFMRIHQRIICGDIANSTATAAFENTDASYLIISSDNDPVVPRKYGYDYWYERYQNDERFHFMLRSGYEEEEAHSYVFCSLEYMEWLRKINEEDYQEWLESLDYDYEAKKNKERFAKDLRDFKDQPYIKEGRLKQVDEALFDEIDAFYMESIGQ